MPGVWIGAQAVSPLWMAICFGIGAGAILQVIVEVTGHCASQKQPSCSRRPASPVSEWVSRGTSRCCSSEAGAGAGQRVGAQDASATEAVGEPPSIQWQIQLTHRLS